MSTAVTTVNPNLPAAIRALLVAQGNELMQEVTGGVTSGFPIISYRGKVWRVRRAGVDEDMVDDEGDPIPSIEVVLIKSNKMPSKIFYEKEYEEGSNEKPRCWSADGVKPDTGVQNPICKTCMACPNNIWGSKVSKASGKPTKACSDARRMAVVSRKDLEERGEEAQLFLLRVPPASLNPLKDYAEKVLKPKGIPYISIVTKIGFDKEASYPKMAFRANRYLSDDEAAAVLKLRDSEDVRRILAESEEFADAGTPGSAEASSKLSEEGTPAPAAAAPKKANKPRPAEEEDVGLEDAPPAPPAKKAAVKPPVVEADEEEEIAPPPAKAVAKPKKAAPPPVEEEEEPAPPPKKAAAKPAKVATPPPVDDDGEEEIAPPAPAAKPAKAKAKPAPVTDAPEDGNDFDSMLNSILGS